MSIVRKNKEIWTEKTGNEIHTYQAIEDFGGCANCCFKILKTQCAKQFYACKFEDGPCGINCVIKEIN